MSGDLLARIWKGRWGYCFVLPALIPFVIFTVYPLLQGIWLSFYKAGVNRAKWTFIGLDNYVRLFTRDNAFQIGVKNTFLFVLVVVPVALVISLFVAVIVYPLRQRSQTFFRIAFYMPVVSAGVILAMVWLIIYSREFGLLNASLEMLGIFKLFGIDKIGWLAQPDTALLSLSLVVISWSLGQPLILFRAGLGAIPEELYEAAKLDGAAGWQQFWRITLPLLQPTVLFVLVTLTIAVFQVFVVVLLMTLGGPANATQTIVFRLYENAFTFFKFGYASAMAVVLLAIISVVAAVQFRLLDRQAH
ncbi:MAG: sugar ABC transporter permease [Trueperaceae bacterium]|nr:MAG: sugar ABC transporter permease [Trueperaceae bacterium]